MVLHCGRALLLLISLPPSLTLNLGVTRPVSFQRLATRMQMLDEQAETPAQTSAETIGVGRVVPTPSSADSEALKQRILSEKPQLGTSFRRAEFWLNDTISILEVINVLGRFEKTTDFRERTEFSIVENPREEDEKQSETKNRYEMAQRMGCAERVALYQNAPKLPFTNKALADSVGLSLEDFEGLEVSKAACNVVFDALAESRSGLISYSTLDARRASLIDSDGSFSEINFRLGLYKSRAIICASWFLFGKGNFIWVLVSVKFLHDWKPDLIPSPVDMGLFKIGTFI